MKPRSQNSQIQHQNVDSGAVSASFESAFRLRASRKHQKTFENRSARLQDGSTSDTGAARKAVVQWSQSKERTTTMKPHASPCEPRRLAAASTAGNRDEADGRPHGDGLAHGWPVREPRRHGADSAPLGRFRWLRLPAAVFHRRHSGEQRLRNLIRQPDRRHGRPQYDPDQGFDVGKHGHRQNRIRPDRHGIIIYQSTSGDAEASTGEHATFQSVDSTLSSAHRIRVDVLLHQHDRRCGAAEH